MKSLKYALIITIAFASCAGKKTDNKEQQLADLKKERAQVDAKIAKLELNNPDTSRKPTPVAVVAVQPTNFNAFVEVQSQVLSDQNVYAIPQAPGTVTSLNVKPGDHVSQGQVLATLDAATIEQQAKAQDVQLQLAKALYDKQQKLWAQNIGTEVQLLQSKANYDALVKQKEGTIAQRNMYRIVAPISGVVDQVDIKIGQQAGGIMGGIRIVNNSQLKVEANLGENYLGKVQIGDRVTIIFPDINDSIESKVSYVSQAVDASSRAFLVQIRLAGDKKLHPNMSCKLRITNYENKAALVVPVGVIQKTAGGDILYIADGNKAKSVVVTTGRNANGMIEILSGLNPGDKVITDGYRELDNGQLIKVQ